jgi:hypothetical protein
VGLAVPRANTAALAYVTSFVADVKTSGFVTTAIEQTGLAGVRVVP